MAVETQQRLASKSRGGQPADPEVFPKASRRRFGAAYKARILEEVDRAAGHTGAILRREGLYSSHLSKWREQRRNGTLVALGKRRGPKGKSATELENEKLRRENARLARELERAKILIDAQKKLAVILGVDLPKITETGEDS